MYGTNYLGSAYYAQGFAGELYQQVTLSETVTITDTLLSAPSSVTFSESITLVDRISIEGITARTLFSGKVVGRMIWNPASPQDPAEYKE